MQIFSSGKILLTRTAPILLALLALTACTFSSPPVTTPEATAVGAESLETESPQTEAPTTVPSATESSTVEPPDDETAMPANGSSLAGTSWELVAFGDSDGAMPVLENSTITLHFGTDGQVTGNGGCNEYGGSYVIQDSTVVFGEIISTLVACVDQEITTQEQSYLQALGGAGRFEVTEDQLTIWYGGDNGAANGILNFVPADAAPEDTSPVIPPVTPSEPETLLPTVTPQPSDATGGLPVDEARRIEFGTGETSATIEATIAERETDYYVAQAQQGQIMGVEIMSPNTDVLLTVVGEDGTPLKRYQNGPPSWTSQLPATQDYFIYAVSVGSATLYTLQVWIEDTEGASAERVEFEPGAITANRSGVLSDGDIQEFVLDARAGQTMHVQTVGYGAPVTFTVSSPSGERWSGEAQASEVYIFTAQEVLPEDGDYTVTLSVPLGADATRYDVVFTITDSPISNIPSAADLPKDAGEAELFAWRQL